jgi:peroxiredoxin
MRPTAVPATRVRALDSSETELAAALRGRPALVSLWATWCDACREEMPALRRLDAWAKSRGSLVVGVAVGESLAKVTSFNAEARLPYLVLVDEEFRLSDALGEKRVPATLVVDRNGRIVFTGGAVDERSLAVFEKLVAETPAELGPGTRPTDETPRLAP